MKKFFKFLVFSLTILILISVLGRAGAFGQYSNKIMLNFSTPIIDFLTLPFRFIESSWSIVGDNRGLINENYKLRQKVMKLEMAADQAKDLTAQISKYDALEQTDYDTIGARVVLKDNLGWEKTIILNKGSKDGVIPNMAVLVGAGLVGKITDVGWAYSKVLLINDRLSKIGARLRYTRNTGILEGRGAKQPILNFLPNEAGVFIGDEVVTSGLGGLFPAGFLIGTVTKTVVEDYGFYQYATVTPIVDFNTLELVSIVKHPPPAIDVAE